MYQFGIWDAYWFTKNSLKEALFNAAYQNYIVLTYIPIIFPMTPRSQFLLSCTWNYGAVLHRRLNVEILQPVMRINNNIVWDTFKLINFLEQF